MSAIVVGQYPASCSRDSEGYRTYKIKFLVLHDLLDGPTASLTASGLPAYGSIWQFAAGNDVDSFAWCRWDADVQPYGTEKELGLYHTVELTFSTKPLESKRCHQQEAGNPLLEPPKISGGFTKYTEEATHDRFGQPLFNSAWEMLRGPQVEFDHNRPTVKIEQPVADFSVVVLAFSVIDHVNSSPMWGFGVRCVKLSNVSWEKKFYGACFFYYLLTTEFDVRPDGSFDRDLLDEGHKVLNGHWDPSTTPPAAGLWVVDNVGSVAADPNNPTHFIRYKDRNDENTSVILNGAGLPAFAGIQTTGPNTRYVALSTNTGLPGLSLQDPSSWRVLLDPDETGLPPTWDVFESYKSGSLVIKQTAPPGPPVDDVYIANGNIGANYPTYAEPPDAPWIFVSTLAGLKDQGKYDPTKSYLPGSIVSPPDGTTTTGSPGHRFVQFYHETDFTLLGVPVTL